MSYALTLTAAGQAALSDAIISGNRVVFGAVAISGIDSATLTPASADIGEEFWRAAPVSVSAVESGQVRIRAIIPAEAGGWTFRSIGIFAGVSGELLAYAAVPQSYKPLPSQDTAGAIWTIDLLLIIGSAAANAVVAPAVADWLAALIAANGPGAGGCDCPEPVLIGAATIYVDGNGSGNGNDNNDGYTALTPVRTGGRVNALFRDLVTRGATSIEIRSLNASDIWFTGADETKIFEGSAVDLTISSLSTECKFSTQVGAGFVVRVKNLIIRAIFDCYVAPATSACLTLKAQQAFTVLDYDKQLNASPNPYLFAWGAASSANVGLVLEEGGNYQFTFVAYQFATALIAQRCNATVIWRNKNESGKKNGTYMVSDGATVKAYNSGNLWTGDGNIVSTAVNGGTVEQLPGNPARFIGTVSGSGGSGGSGGGGTVGALRSGAVPIVPGASSVTVSFSPPFPAGAVPSVVAFVRQPNGADNTPAAGVQAVSITGATVLLMSEPETSGYVLNYIAVQQ